MKYPIAKNGIFWSVQGEGHLRGFQMAFVRLAGCSVGCPECDTDYSVARGQHPEDVRGSMTAEEVAEAAWKVTPEGATSSDRYRSRDRWVWITGGEPLDHDLGPLYKALRARGFSLALATSGKFRAIQPLDWLSVSYHGHHPFAQRYGNELKLVVGLNGLDPFDFIRKNPDQDTDFFYRYVQPLTVDGVEDPKSLEICKEFLRAHPDWGLSRQDHVAWGVA